MADLPKSMNTMSLEELSQLKAGDHISSMAERAPDFRHIIVDSVIVLGAYPASVVVSLVRAEAREITTTAIVREAVGLGLSVTPESVAARPATIEEGQLRLTPEGAADMAVALLQNLATALPDLVKAKLATSGLAHLVSGHDASEG